MDSQNENKYQNLKIPNYKIYCQIKFIYKKYLKCKIKNILISNYLPTKIILLQIFMRHDFDTKIAPYEYNEGILFVSGLISGKEMVYPAWAHNLTDAIKLA